MRKLSDSEIMRIQDGMAIMSPLVGEYSGDEQGHKLATLSLASAGSFVLLLVMFPILVRTSGRRDEAQYGLVDARIADANSSFADGLRRSLDQETASPCDDFYSFVCGRWSLTYPQLAHQFHVLDNRVRLAALRRVAALSPGGGAANMSAPNKVGHALALCLGEHESEHDHSSVVAQLLRSLGIDWPKLAAVANRSRTFNFFHVFLTLSQKMGLPLFFHMLPEMDLRYRNWTVLTVSPAWLQASLADSRSESNLLLLAALYGREDLSKRLSRVHGRVALSAAGLHNGQGSQKPMYTTVDRLSGFNVHMPPADVLLAMINVNFPPKNQVTMTDDVYVTTGGLPAILLAGVFAHEIATDDAEAAGAFVSTMLLWRLAVPSSATLSSMLHLSKYRCFELLQDVAPHATALFLAEDIVPASNIDTVDAVIVSVRKILAADLAKLPESERTSYYEKLRMIQNVVEVPDDLFDDAVLERHYSSLPVFRAPFVRSYLLALQRRADRARATLHRRVATTRRMSHRLTTLAARPVLLPFYSVLHVPVASLLSPMVVRESAEATYAALGHLVARELVSALDLSAGNTAPNGLAASPRSGARAAVVHSRLACLQRYAPAKTGAAGMEEVYADAAGLQVALRALRTTPAFKPLEQSTLVQGWSRLQLFYMSSCYKWCALHANEAGGTVVTHRERCNAPVAEHGAFLSAFNCSAESRMSRKRKGCFPSDGS